MLNRAERAETGRQRSLANLKPWKPGQAGRPTGGRPKGALAVIKAKIQDAGEQYEMIARIARGEVIYLQDPGGPHTDEETEEERQARRKTLRLAPTVAQIRQAAAYLIDRRWGKIPAYTPHDVGEPVPGMEGLELPEGLRMTLRQVAHELTLERVGGDYHQRYRLTQRNDEAIDVTPADGSSADAASAPSEGSLDAPAEAPRGAGSNRGPSAQAGGPSPARQPSVESASLRAANCAGCGVSVGELHLDACPYFGGMEPPRVHGGVPQCTCQAEPGEPHRDGCAYYEIGDDTLQCVTPDPEPVNPVWDAFFGEPVMSETRVSSPTMSDGLSSPAPRPDLVQGEAARAPQALTGGEGLSAPEPSAIDPDATLRTYWERIAAERAGA